MRGGSGGRFDAGVKFSRNTKFISFKRWPTFLLSPRSASGMYSWIASGNVYLLPSVSGVLSEISSLLTDALMGRAWKALG